MAAIGLLFFIVTATWRTHWTLLTLFWNHCHLYSDQFYKNTLLLCKCHWQRRGLQLGGKERVKCALGSDSNCWGGWATSDTTLITAPDHREQWISVLSQGRTGKCLVYTSISLFCSSVTQSRDTGGHRVVYANKYSISFHVTTLNKLHFATM